MVLDLDVLLLVGVDYDDVVTSRENVVSVTTKYNPDTGAPYESKKFKKVWLIGEKVFDEEWEAYTALEKEGLSVYEEHGDPVLIGVTLDKNEGYRVASGLGGYVTTEDIDVAINDIKEALIRLGVNSSVISIRTFSRVSC